MAYTSQINLQKIFNQWNMNLDNYKKMDGDIICPILKDN